MRRTNGTAAAIEQRAPGAFMPDGSWNEDAELHHQGHVHRLVAGLIRERQSGRLSPEDAARTIRAASADGAFPNVGQWAGSDSWTMARTSTAAEECVRREGRGEDGHWCGPQRWLDGSDRACPEPRHRVRSRPDQVAASLDSIRALISCVGSGSADAPESAEQVGGAA